MRDNNLIGKNRRAFLQSRTKLHVPIYLIVQYLRLPSARSLSHTKFKIHFHLILKTSSNV